jgi:hypothetical protein
MTEFNKGQEHYKNGGRVTRRYGTFSGEFHRGYVAEERISRCGYNKLHWNKSNRVKSY